MSNIKSKINIYISSKYRQQDEQTSDFKVVIPDGLLKCARDEYFTLNINCFYVYNTFYQCNANYNHFQLWFYTSGGLPYMFQDLYLTIGNPNIFDVMNNINTLISVYGNVSYDRIKNKFIYTRTYAQDSNYYNMYLVAINANSFLGFTNITKNLILTTGTYSTNPININPIQAINVTIGGDISFENNNIDNCYGRWQNSDIIIQKAIDVPMNGLIKYENVDGGDSFQYWLHNTDRIKYFELNVYDQDMNEIPDFPDYYLHVQFNIREKLQNNELLEKNIEYTKHNFLILGYIFDILNHFYKLLFNKNFLT